LQWPSGRPSTGISTRPKMAVSSQTRREDGDPGEALSGGTPWAEMQPARGRRSWGSVTKWRDAERARVSLRRPDRGLECGRLRGR